MKKQTRDKLRAQIERTKSRHAVLQKSLAATERGAAPGDLFALPAPLRAEYVLNWAIIRLSPAGEAKRFFVVPVDQNPLAGSDDVAVPREAPGGPCTLRCGQGVWIDAERLLLEQRIDVLDEEVVDRADRAIEAADVGDSNVSRNENEHRSEVDADPEYQEWMDEVQRQVEWLTEPLPVALAAEQAKPAALRGPAVISFSSADFRRPTLPPSGRIVALAAAPALSWEPPAPDNPAAGIPLRCQIPGELPGILSAILETGGIAIEYIPFGTELPPPIQPPVEAGTAKPTAGEDRWLKSPRATYRFSRVFAWVNGRIEFAIELPSGPQQVVITNETRSP